MDVDYPPLAALVVTLAACVTDVRSRRIPNALTFGAALAAFLYHVAAAGTDGAATAIAGWGVGALVFMPLFVLGGMGAGDVKLLAAIGAWLGPAPAIWVALYSSVCGGALALIVALARGYLRTAVGNVGRLVGYWWTVGLRPAPGLTLESSTSPRLAYAVPICLGLGMTLWLR